MSDVMDDIRNEISRNKVMMYIKGTRSAPQCGFTAATVAVFNALGYPYETVDVLADPQKREAIKVFSNWPTIPQVYVNGKFIGGCDIVQDLNASGELQQIVAAAFVDATS